MLISGLAADEAIMLIKIKLTYLMMFLISMVPGCAISVLTDGISSSHEI